MDVVVAGSTDDVPIGENVEVVVQFKDGPGAGFFDRLMRILLGQRVGFGRFDMDDRGADQPDHAASAPFRFFPRRQRPAPPRNIPCRDRLASAPDRPGNCADAGRVAANVKDANRPGNRSQRATAWSSAVEGSRAKSSPDSLRLRLRLLVPSGRDCSQVASGARRAEFAVTIPHSSIGRQTSDRANRGWRLPAEKPLQILRRNQRSGSGPPPLAQYPDLPPLGNIEFSRRPGCESPAPQTPLMPAIFDKLGIKFLYPDDWTLEVATDQDEEGVTVYSPGGGFWSVVIRDGNEDPAELAKVAVAAIRR